MPTGDADWLALPRNRPWSPSFPSVTRIITCGNSDPSPCPINGTSWPSSPRIRGGHNVRATVFIEVKARYRPDGPEGMRPVGEVEFVEGLATESARGRDGRTRMAAAIIGYADLKLGERVAPVLDAMQAASPTRFAACDIPSGGMPVRTW